MVESITKVRHPQHLQQTDHDYVFPTDITQQSSTFLTTEQYDSRPTSFIYTIIPLHRYYNNGERTVPVSDAGVAVMYWEHCFIPRPSSFVSQSLRTTLLCGLIITLLCYTVITAGFNQCYGPEREIRSLIHPLSFARPIYPDDCFIQQALGAIF